MRYVLTNFDARIYDSPCIYKFHDFHDYIDLYVKCPVKYIEAPGWLQYNWQRRSTLIYKLSNGAIHRTLRERVFQ